MVKKKDLSVDFDLSDASINIPQIPKEKKIEPEVETISNKNETEVMKRITLDLPLSLHKKFKMLAIEQNKTMTNLLRTWIKENTE